MPQNILNINDDNRGTPFTCWELNRNRFSSWTLLQDLLGLFFREQGTGLKQVAKYRSAGCGVSHLVALNWRTNIMDRSSVRLLQDKPSIFFLMVSLHWTTEVTDVIQNSKQYWFRYKLFFFFIILKAKFIFILFIFEKK